MSVALLEKQLLRIADLKESGPWGQDYKFWLATTRKVVSSVAGKEYLPFLKGLEITNGEVILDKIAKHAGRIPSSYHAQLDAFGEMLQRIIGELALSPATSHKPKASEQVKVGEYELHTLINAVSSERFKLGQYPDAVEAAFKEVIKRVKDFVNPQLAVALDGEKLMNRAFGCESQTPIIKFNALVTEGDRDEQKGIMNLFKGMVGIRNRKAHENVVMNDPQRAMEYLALASLQMRLLDEHTTQSVGNKLEKKDAALLVSPN